MTWDCLPSLEEIRAELARRNPPSLPPPQPGPQTEFLAAEADIVIYGGAAGGGKSFGLLLDCARFVDVPGYTCVIFRRNSKQIMSAGGLWEKAAGLYTSIGGKSRLTDHTWRFAAHGGVPLSPDPSPLQGKGGLEEPLPRPLSEAERGAWRQGRLPGGDIEVEVDRVATSMAPVGRDAQPTIGLDRAGKGDVEDTDGCRHASQSRSMPLGGLDRAGEDGQGRAFHGSDLTAQKNGTSVIQFAHLEHEDSKSSWDGAELAYIGFDELQHLSETQFFYLLSRNRSTCGVRPRIRATCNPSPNWLRRFLAPWVDKSFASPAESGEVRYFVRIDGQIVWVGKDYRDEEGMGPKSMTFIRSTIYDNKILLRADPGYLSSLKAMHTAERRRLLYGDWDVLEGAFFAEWNEEEHTIIPPYRRGGTHPASFLGTPPEMSNSVKGGGGRGPLAPNSGGTGPTIGDGAVEAPGRAVPFPNNEVGYEARGSVPRHWRYFGGLDWGYGSPFAFVLCAVDEDGRVHVMDELHERMLTTREQASKVLGVLNAWGVDRRACLIAADPRMFSRAKRADLIGEADIEAFYRAGLQCVEANDNREHGWNRVRDYLQSTDRFKVWRGYCSHLIEQFPLMQYSSTKPNDMETDADDHLHDCLRYALMTRPRASEQEAGTPVERSSIQQYLIGHKRPGRGGYA